MPPEDVESASAEATSAIDMAVSEPPAPDAIEVHCTPEATTLSTPVVKPGPAGVALRVVNDVGKPVYVTLLSAQGGRGDRVSGPSRETIEPLAPGPVDIACYDPDDPAQDPPSSPGYLQRVARFEIVDEDRVWRPDTLECLDEQRGGASASFGEDAGRPREELPDMLRDWLKLPPTDEVRPAGYPEQPGAPLVVVRDGRVVARGSTAKLEHGWVVDSVEACTSDVPIG
jgi:hypothetical protein